MHQLCLEELTIRVMELERQMRAVHLDAQTARSSRFAQIKEMQDLQARAAAADERAAATDERSAIELIKTAQALNQCKVKQQQYRQLQISLHRELVANMQEQQQQLVQINDQQQDLLDSNGLVQLQLEDMLLAQVLLKQQLFSEQTAAAATASADAAAQAAASVEGGLAAASVEGGLAAVSAAADAAPSIEGLQGELAARQAALAARKADLEARERRLQELDGCRAAEQEMQPMQRQMHEMQESRVRITLFEALDGADHFGAGRGTPHPAGRRMAPTSTIIP